MSSFTKKQIDVVFTINQGGFGGASETIELKAHRVGCQILSTGYESGMMCALRIEGMRLSTMNRLSVAQTNIVGVSPNTVTVMAGDGDAMPTIFTGGITEAFVDYASAPNIAFQVSALSTSIPAAMPIFPTSFADSASVADIMKTIAEKIGFRFVNHGVDAVLAGGTYYPGTATQQIDSCARAAGIDYHMGNQTLSIWPQVVSADNGAAITVSADTGMIGYPNYSQGGVLIQTLFNPDVNFRDTIKLESEYAPAAWVNNNNQLRAIDGSNSTIPPSNGLWVVQKIEHDLQTELPDGPWFTMMEAQRPEFAGKIAFAR